MKVNSVTVERHQHPVNIEPLAGNKLITIKPSRKTVNRQNMTKTMSNEIKTANTATIEGRQLVANACKSFYNEIEEDVYNADAEWMLKGLYNDLCNGNFAEPFMCEKKKETLADCIDIYNTRILPRL